MNKYCTICDGAHSFNPGIKGKNSDKTKIMMVLHQSDMRALESALPGFNSYETVLWQTQTGRILNEMLKFCNLSPNEVYITNLIKCLFDRKITTKDYRSCKSNLLQQIGEFEPRAIMVFGQKPVQYLLNTKKLEDVLHIYSDWFCSFPTMAFNHPSAPWLKSGYWKNSEYQFAKEFLEKADII